jgi:hypothetical protein
MAKGISPKELGAIKRRQKSRAEEVRAAHDNATVWACYRPAEECFNDLERLLRVFEEANN